MAQIREFNAGDIDYAQYILLDSLDQFYDTSTIIYFHQQWSSGQLVACDVIGRPIGVLFSIKAEDGNARVMMFAVQSKYRNSGIGTALLQRFRNICMMNGFRSIELEVRIENENARRFYLKNGFRETEYMEHYYQNGGGGIRMVAPVLLNA